MNQLLIAEILTSDSDEIADLRSNISTLENFIDLAKQIDALPDISKRFYEESRSLFQATSTGRDIAELESMLAKLFGPPVKPAGQPFPRKLKKNSSVKYLGGIQKEQSLFLLSLKTGEFYGALWPWRRNKEKIEIHLGYCSDWITDEDYQQIETFAKRSLSQSAFEKMDTAVGGQIHGISLPSFLQMAEMERSNFSLRITSGSKVGRVFVKDGVLIAAQVDDIKGRQAAYQIISWDDTSIEITPVDDTKTDEIMQPLMHILMESLKIKDEATAAGQPQLPPKQKRPGKKQEAQANRLVRLERAPTPSIPRDKAKSRIMLAGLLGLLLLAGILFVANIYWKNNRGATENHEQIMARVESAETPEQKLVLLENYLQTPSGSQHINEVKKKIEETHKTLEDRDFEKVTLQVSQLTVDEQYEKKAISMYGDFLEKYTNSSHAQQINQAIADIKNLLDQYYYEELKRAARLDFKERLQTYQDYISRFPQGRYRQDVAVLIDQMGNQYFNFLKSEAEQCDKIKRWDSCIKRCETFIEVYGGNTAAEEAQHLKIQMTDKRDLAKLQEKAIEYGTDYQKAYDAYKDFLAQHPQTTQKKSVEEELEKLGAMLGTQKKWLSARAYAMNTKNGIFERIQQLDKYIQTNISGPYSADAQELMRQLEAERQVRLRQQKTEAKKQEEQTRIQLEMEKRAQQQQRASQFSAQLQNELSGSPRYRTDGDGTVTDLTTGLTWALLDVYQELGGCLDHEAALKYVQNLRHGGRSDWRLPTASELAGIYKHPPFYPASGAEWYWTSESYVKGYHTVTDVVTAKPEQAYSREFRKVSECGSVRAVRP